MLGHLIEPLNLGRHDEVTLREAVDLVGPELNADLAPSEINIRVMALLLGQFADPVGEFQRFAEILELVRAVEVMPVASTTSQSGNCRASGRISSVVSGGIPPRQGMHCLSASSCMFSPLLLAIVARVTLPAASAPESFRSAWSAWKPVNGLHQISATLPENQP